MQMLQNLTGFHGLLRLRRDLLKSNKLTKLKNMIINIKLLGIMKVCKFAGKNIVVTRK